MSRKPAQRFRAVSAGSRRLRCDFSSLRGARAVSVKIGYVCGFSATNSQTAWGVHLPGNFHARRDHFSGARRARKDIRSYWIEKMQMRGAVIGKVDWNKDPQMRRRCLIRNYIKKPAASDRARGAHPVAVRGPLLPKSFLFCLTGAAIFDNRHGLLEKTDNARAAKPLSSPPKPNK